MVKVWGRWKRSQWRDFTVAPTVTTFKLEQHILQFTFLPFHSSSTITSSVCVWWTLVLRGKLDFVITVVESTVIFMARLKASDGIFTCISLSHNSFFSFWDQSEMETLLPVCCQWSVISQRSLSTTPAFPNVQLLMTVLMSWSLKSN